MNKFIRVLALSTIGLLILSCAVFAETTAGEDWISAPSMKEAYAGKIDKIGIAVTYDELKRDAVQKGLVHHCNTITMGNEFKPDFIFNWTTPNTAGTFTDSTGFTISVPTNTPVWTKPDAIMKICKDNNLQMRGHVLVWHSQTPVWFFRNDYKLAGSMVDKQTMNARMEWYIKTVLNHVADWETKNNDGKHIIYAWDVVNEAASDSAAGSRFLRGSNGEQSNWYAVYKDDSFIVNAFRFANKYAPADVLLSYNDYNTYSGNKTTAILKIIDDIQAAEKDATLPTRLNVLGMQSHVSMSYPSVSSYESTVKKFLAKGLDVQVTELDIANGKDKYDAEKLKAKYKEYFTIFLNNRKVDGKNGIIGVTIWGIDDATTWLNALGMYKGYRQYPLLFNADYTCKPAFYGVIEAAQK